jgi:dipeptidase D
VDEETGLTGAQRLEGKLLRARTLLNLDSEEDGVLFVGCAGGTDTTLTLAAGRMAHEPAIGRSGSRSRGCAAGTRAQHRGEPRERHQGGGACPLHRHAAGDRVPDRVPERRGEAQRHPREAEALLPPGPGEERRLQAVLEETLRGFQDVLAGVDDGLAVRLLPGSDGSRVLQPPAADRLLRLLVAPPPRVLAMSRAIPGLVETSSNLAVVETRESVVRIVTSSRSSVAPALTAVLAQIEAQGTLAGAEAELTNGYPGWKPNLASPVLGVVRRVYTEVFGKEPQVTAIHAGLECGLIGEKVPGWTWSPSARSSRGCTPPTSACHVPSVARFWRALGRTLEELAG